MFRFLLALLLVSMVMPATAMAEPGPGILDGIQQRGVLRVGFDTFVPWAMKDKNGEYIGFETDVARRLAQDMGVQVEFVPTKWSGIIPALLTGKFDIIIGGMGILPSRNLKVNFSRPYEYSGMSMVASRKLAPDMSTLADFDKPEVTLAVKTGATSVAAAKKHMPRATLRMFDDEAQALQEVLNGRAHAMVASAPFPEQQAIRHRDALYLPLNGETFTKEPIGFAIRKGDVDFLNFLDNWIAVTESEGWLAERHAYWFRTMDWETKIK
ncbi:MAG: transporter substrate-binding domain-containing protein [Deltaproteobacteria bacterium]|nr:transporter substrate-binding domain-containing protein [Deltaproteobacteria bacterium]